MNPTQSTNLIALGRLVKEYKRSTASVVTLVVVALLLFAFAAFLIVAAIFSTQDSISTRHSAAILGGIFLLPVIVCLLFLLKGRASLSLYENGIVYHRKGKDSITTWDDVEVYAEGVAGRIQKKNGEQFDIGRGLKDEDEFFEKIQEQTLIRLGPRVKAAIFKGETVTFKGLQPSENRFLKSMNQKMMRAFLGFTVDTNGITALDNGRRIAWKDVTECGINQQHLGRMPINLFYIADRDISLQTNIGLLCNAHVLLDLCSDMVRLNQPGATSPGEDGY
ncbi:MAG: hypothetical protein QOH96_2467 [Blastocatellia bacterium]|jgi:hypothetical protein|nr:hypothetical protein [Blastocatellia bacterium]